MGKDPRAALEDFLEKQKDLQAKLAENKRQVESLNNELAKSEVETVTKLIDKFAKLFRSGVVIQTFNQIMEHLTTLEGYNQGYHKMFEEIEFSDPGEKNFLIQLIGGPLNKDSNIWNVLENLSGKRGHTNNFFINNGGQ